MNLLIRPKENAYDWPDLPEILTVESLVDYFLDIHDYWFSFQAVEGKKQNSLHGKKDICRKALIDCLNGNEIDKQDNYEVTYEIDYVINKFNIEFYKDFEVLVLDSITTPFDLKKMGFTQAVGHPDNVLTNGTLTIWPEFANPLKPLGNAWWRFADGKDIPPALKPKTNAQLLDLLSYMKSLDE
jgi:hypothetical protein